MLDLFDHAAGRRCVRHVRDAADPVEPEPDQGRALGMVAADRAAGLLDLDGFRCFAHLRLPPPSAVQSAACSLSPSSRRRDCSVDTLMLRRAATERGESWRLSASKVARTML